MAGQPPEKDLRTVFVRGVSFDATEKDLEALFSDVGPVKHSFLVRQKGQARHKGFGFVQYAIEEDAERAVEELNGKDMSGRKIKVGLTVEQHAKSAPLASAAASCLHASYLCPLCYVLCASVSHRWSWPPSALR